MTYPMSVGRNFAEILRVIDALQTGDKFRIATPADWEVGKDVIIPPSIKDDEAATLFPSRRLDDAASLFANNQRRLISMWMLQLDACFTQLPTRRNGRSVRVN